jgi:hypothetical protein
VQHAQRKLALAPVNCPAHAFCLLVALLAGRDLLLFANICSALPEMSGRGWQSSGGLAGAPRYGIKTTIL